MDIERRETRDIMIHVRVGPTLHRRAELACAAAGVTMSELVRSGMREVARSILAGIADSPNGDT